MNSFLGFSVSSTLAMVGINVTAHDFPLLGWITAIFGTLGAVAIGVYWLIKAWVLVVKFKRWLKNNRNNIDDI